MLHYYPSESILLKLLHLSKVDHVVRLSSLIQRLQEERAAVALNLFINRTSSLDTLNDLQAYVKTPGWDITRFSYRKVTWILKDSKLRNNSLILNICIYT